MATICWQCNYKKTKCPCVHQFCGEWKGILFDKDSNTHKRLLLQFVSVDTVKQKVDAFVVDEYYDTVFLAGTIKGLQIDMECCNEYKLFGWINTDDSCKYVFSGKIIRFTQNDTLSFSFQKINCIDDPEPIPDNCVIAPEIIFIKRSPDRLRTENETYTVVIITNEKAVPLEDTEFSLDGKEWQKNNTFQNLKSGKYTFYVRNACNKRSKSLQDQKNIVLPDYELVEKLTVEKLNELLKKIADNDDDARDELQKYGNKVTVRGVAGINNLEELRRAACINLFTAQKVEYDNNGNLVLIIVTKN